MRIKILYEKGPGAIGALNPPGHQRLMFAESFLELKTALRWFEVSAGERLSVVKHVSSIPG